MVATTHGYKCVYRTGIHFSCVFLFKCQCMSAQLCVVKLSHACYLCPFCLCVYVSVCVCGGGGVAGGGVAAGACGRL